ncbi:hypothetical protein [Sphingosinicella humi]|uniref:Uncharacterized protein n=1 Tax=Allosphingosinicella humi TaxID=2068657 RepID=A0A2U2IZ60_9SPHN|nr:hypothetical protein [Sphingosinicella humi]PWG01369.1 hypothetical protein DF286_14710 [Sphingosinicella humi]
MPTSPTLAEAWLLAVVIVAGLAVGSLGLLMIGRLLGRDWVTPMDDELEPAAYTIPLVAILALPLAFQSFYAWDGAAALADSHPRLSGWFERDLILLRSLGYFLLWSALAWLAAARPKAHGWNAAGLLLLLPTVGLAGLDWVLTRQPFWWTSLFGFAFAVSQLPAALALAFLANTLQREHVGHAHDRSLVSALLVLALLTLWLWFTQYLAAFMGNLPAEAAWYQARLVDGRWIPLALAAGLLGGAILLLVQGHRGRWVVLVASGLILAQHFFHMGWLLRPAGTPALGLLDLLALVLIGGVWGLAWLLLMRRHDARRRQLGGTGSS